MWFVHFLKRTIRDLRPISRESARVLDLVESALGPTVVEMDLSEGERGLLLDVVHSLVNLLDEHREFAPDHVEALQGKLNELANRYEVCPA